MGKAPGKKGVLQTVVVKIVTEILFGQFFFPTLLTADHRPAHEKNRELDHARAMSMDYTGVVGSTDTASSYFQENTMSESGYLRTL